MRNPLIRVGLVSLLVGLCGTPLVAGARDGVFGCPAGQVAQAIDIKAEQFVCVALPDPAGDVTALQATVAAQSALIETLQTAVADLQAKLGCMSKTGDEVYFTGCNVHVRNGMGGTGAGLNGLGNLIVGYNEDATLLPFVPQLEPSIRTGSHNIVIGAGHSYTDRGGLVVGVANKITARYATVTGGLRNTASGAYSSVNGGRENTASGDFSSVTAGHQNTASGPNPYASVSGGFHNTASGFASSVSGGGENSADGFATSVSGGQLNTATGGQASSVSGGFHNTASAEFSSVSGGENNTASAKHASVSGGAYRNAPTEQSWAAGSLFEPN